MMFRLIQDLAACHFDQGTPANFLTKQLIRAEYAGFVFV